MTSQEWYRGIKHNSEKRKTFISVKTKEGKFEVPLNLNIMLMFFRNNK